MKESDRSFDIEMQRDAGENEKKKRKTADDDERSNQKQKFNAPLYGSQWLNEEEIRPSTSDVEEFAAHFTASIASLAPTFFFGPGLTFILAMSFGGATRFRDARYESRNHVI